MDPSTFTAEGEPLAKRRRSSRDHPQKSALPEDSEPNVNVETETGPRRGSHRVCREVLKKTNPEEGGKIKGKFTKVEKKKKFKDRCKEKEEELKKAETFDFGPEAKTDGVLLKKVSVFSNALNSLCKYLIGSQDDFEFVNQLTDKETGSNLVVNLVYMWLKKAFEKNPDLIAPFIAPKDAPTLQLNEVGHIDPDAVSRWLVGRTLLKHGAPLHSDEVVGDCGLISICKSIFGPTRGAQVHPLLKCLTLHFLVQRWEDPTLYTLSGCWIEEDRNEALWTCSVAGKSKPEFALLCAAYAADVTVRTVHPKYPNQKEDVTERQGTFSFTFNAGKSRVATVFNLAIKTSVKTDACNIYSCYESDDPSLYVTNHWVAPIQVSQEVVEFLSANQGELIQLRAAIHSARLTGAEPLAGKKGKKEKRDQTSKKFTENYYTSLGAYDHKEDMVKKVTATCGFKIEEIRFVRLHWRENRNFGKPYTKDCKPAIEPKLGEKLLVCYKRQKNKKKIWPKEIVVVAIVDWYHLDAVAASEFYWGIVDTVTHKYLPEDRTKEKSKPLSLKQKREGVEPEKVKIPGKACTVGCIQQATNLPKCKFSTRKYENIDNWYLADAEKSKNPKIRAEGRQMSAALKRVTNPHIDGAAKRLKELALETHTSMLPKDPRCECRVGSEGEERPFAGVSYVLDYPAMPHLDAKNDTSSVTGIITLHRGRPGDECQRHFLVNYEVEHEPGVWYPCAILLPHGSLIFEAASEELHATNFVTQAPPERITVEGEEKILWRPQRIGIVLMKHKGMDTFFHSTYEPTFLELSKAELLITQQSEAIKKAQEDANEERGRAERLATEVTPLLREELNKVREEVQASVEEVDEEPAPSSPAANQQEPQHILIDDEDNIPTPSSPVNQQEGEPFSSSDEEDYVSNFQSDESVGDEEEDESAGFRCDQVGCKKIFASKDSLNRHKQRSLGHNNTFHTCEYCGKRAVTISMLRRHVTTSHSQRLLHNCPKCDKGFSTAKIRDRHLTEVHSTTRTFVCVSCDHTAKTRSSLNSHIKWHHKPNP